MNNTPYEDDSVLPRVVGLGLVTGVGVGIHKYQKSPTFRNSVQKVVDKISTIKEEDRSYSQNLINDAYNAISSVSSIRSERDIALRKARNDGATQYADKTFESLNDVWGREKVGIKPTGGLSFNDINEIVDIEGRSIGEDIVSKISERLGVNRKAVETEFSGTTMQVKFPKGTGHDTLNVPLWKKLEGNVWAQQNGEAGATYIARMSTMTENAKSGLLLDPMTSLLDALSNRESTDYFYELGSGSKDAQTRARDQLNKKIDRAVDQHSQQKIMESYELKRVLKGHRDSIAQYVTGHEIQEQAGLISKTIVPYEPSLDNIGHVGVIGRNTARVDGSGAVVGRDNAMAYFDFMNGLKEGKTKLGIGVWDRNKGQIVRADKPASSDIVNDVINNFSFNLSQSQTAYGAGSTISGISDANIPEALKSLKSIYFRDNPQNIKYSYTTAKNAINPVVRNKPQHVLPDIHEASVMLNKVKSRGAINVPAIIDPFSSEAIMVAPKILGQRVTKQTEFRLGEVVKDSKLYDYLTTPDEKSIDDLFIGKGEIIGRRKVTGNVRNKEELSGLGEWEYVKAPWDLRITSEHRKNIIERNLGKKESDPLVLFAQYEDRMIKAGAADGVIRGSAVDASLNTNMSEFFRGGAKNVARSRGMGIIPEAAISSDLYKNIWQKAVGSEGMIFGKGRGEYLSSLRSMFLGHISQSTTDVMASGEYLNLLKKYTDIGTVGSSVNISELYRTDGISFTNTNNKAEEVLALQKLFAGSRKAVVSGKETYSIDAVSQEETEEILSKTFKLYGEVLPKYTKDQIVGQSENQLPKEIRDMISSGEISKGDLKDLYTSFALAPHEAEAYTLGRGEGIMRISGINLSNSMNMPYAIREAYMKSMTNASRQMTETRLMYASLNGTMTTDMMQEYAKSTGGTVPIIENVERMRAMMGPGEWLAHSSEAIKDPDIFFNSFLGEELNPNGFFVKTKNTKGAEGYFFHPSGKWNGGMTALPDGSFRPAREEAYTLARAMRQAVNDEGVISGRHLRDLQEDLGKSRVSLMEAAEIKAEGSEYVKLVDNQFLIDTHKKLAQVRKEGLSDTGKALAEDLDFMMGSVTTTSVDSAKTMIHREINDAISMANGDQSKAVQKLDELYGKGNMISEALAKEGDNFNSYEVADKMARKSADMWESLKTKIPNIIEEVKAGNKEAINELKKTISDHGFNNWLTRYPDLYSKSSVKTLGFAAYEMGEARQIAAGHVIKTVFAGDTDGDAVRKMMQWSTLSRTETQRHFDVENRAAYEWMSNLKNNDVLKGLSNRKEGSFLAVPEKYAGEYEKALKMLQEEQVAAAVLTKGLTGSATMKAWGQQAYFEKMLTANKNISGETASMARAAINTLIPLSGPQSIISSKHARAILTGKQLEDGTLENLASMKAVMANLGDIDEKTLNDSIKQLGEVHTLHEWAVDAIQKPSNSNIALKNSQIVEDIKNLDDIRWNWNRKSDEELKRLHNRGWIGAEGEDVNSVISRYNESIKNVKFFSEDESLNQAFGVKKYTHKMDFLSEASQKGGSASNSYAGARIKIENALRRANKTNILDQDEIITKTLDSMESQHAKEMQGYDTLVEEYMRRFDKVGKERVYPMIDKVLEVAGKYATGKNLALAAGGALLGLTAVNLISGDGTPHELNDIPSYNNPSFHNTSYNDMNERRSMHSTHNMNMQTALLTDHNMSKDGLMGHISNLVGLRGYNSSTTIHDGSDPYKADMYQYNS